MIRNLLATAVVVALGGVALAADLKSGPQAGEKVPGPFHPFNVNGEDAGKKACLYCKAGDSPTVAIFARTADDPVLRKLITAVETETAKNTKADLNSFAVFCSDDGKLEGALKDFAEKAKLKNLVLAIDAPEGPEKYNINKDAAVTVVLYKEHVVASNYTFEKGKLTDRDVDKIVAEIGKLVK
jgi:phage/plasmid primase-like uncharacterized protein